MPTTARTTSLRGSPGGAAPRPRPRQDLSAVRGGVLTGRGGNEQALGQAAQRRLAAGVTDAAGATPAATGATPVSAPAPTPGPAIWKQLAAAGIGGQGSRAANVAKLAELGGASGGLAAPPTQTAPAIPVETPGIESAISNLRAQLGESMPGGSANEFPSAGTAGGWGTDLGTAVSRNAGDFLRSRSGAALLDPSSPGASFYRDAMGRRGIDSYLNSERLPASYATNPNLMTKPMTPTGTATGAPGNPNVGSPLLALLRARLAGNGGAVTPGAAGLGGGIGGAGGQSTGLGLGRYDY